MGEIVPFRLCQDQPDETSAHARTGNSISVCFTGPGMQMKKHVVLWNSVHVTNPTRAGSAKLASLAWQSPRGPTCPILPNWRIHNTSGYHQYSTAKLATGNIATHSVDLETGHNSTIVSLGSRPHALLSVACLDAISFISPHCLLTMSQKKVANATRIRASILLGPTRTL